MTTPKPLEIWTLKNGKTVRVEYFMTAHYLCTLLNPIEYGSSRCVLPNEFHAKLNPLQAERVVSDVREQAFGKGGKPQVILAGHSEW